MNLAANLRIVLIWLLLMLATILSLELFRGVVVLPDRWAAIAVIAIAFVKVRYVGLDFMELRHAPWPLRLAFEAWCVGTALVVMILCAQGAG